MQISKEKKEKKDEKDENGQKTKKTTKKSLHEWAVEAFEAKGGEITLAQITVYVQATLGGSAIRRSIGHMLNNHQGCFFARGTGHQRRYTYVGPEQCSLCCRQRPMKRQRVRESL
jgi:hypothetical protein